MTPLIDLTFRFLDIGEMFRFLDTEPLNLCPQFEQKLAPFCCITLHIGHRLRCAACLILSLCFRSSSSNFVMVRAGIFSRKSLF